MATRSSLLPLQVMNDSAGSQPSKVAATNAACAELPHAETTTRRALVMQCSKPACADKALRIREARNNDELKRRK